MYGRKVKPNPINKVKEWSNKIDDRATDVSNRMKMNGKQPSQWEWENYKSLVDAHRSMGEWLEKLGDRYTPYFKEYYSDGGKRASFRKDSNKDFIKF
jgi:hypothetical protein